MKKIFFLCTAILLQAVLLIAEEAPGTPVANRFLFVVENSAAATRSAKAARETVRALIESGIQGQMRPGDTLGLWTFNENLNTSYPMQQWSPTAGNQIGARAEEFLKKLKFEKKGKLEVVLPPLESVVQASKAITIILVSSGTDPIQGTPFDESINSIYSGYARTLRDSKTPFVTILVGRNGKFFSHAVNAALDALQIPNPPLAQEPVVAQAKTNAPAKSSVSATNQVAPPRKIAKANIIFPKPVVTNPLPVVNPIIATNSEVKVESTNPIIAAVPIILTNNAIATALTTNPPPAPVTKAPVVVSPALTVTTQTTVVGVKPTNATLVASKVEKLPQPRSAETTNSRVENPKAASPETQDSVVPIVATPTPSRPRNFILMGVSLLVIAGLLIFLLLRSSRGKAHSSLISQSMKQPPK